MADSLSSPSDEQAETQPTALETPTADYDSTTPANLKHMQYKLHMLELINAERERAGVPAVVLGENIAAQMHADASHENCTSSHWSSDGLKPYMRYSLAGGYQANGENGLGLDYCYTAADRVAPIGDVREEVADAVYSWMDSPGHRRNLLNPSHRQVNIGIAWDRYNFKAYQHFEGDYVEYSTLLIIEDGVLTIEGTLKNDARLVSQDDLGVQIYYDPPPHQLTRGQLSRTYCYDSGTRVASLRPPLTGNAYYPEDDYVEEYAPCPDPYTVPPDVGPPRFGYEAHADWREAYNASESRSVTKVTVPWITAKVWRVERHSFKVAADIGRVIERRGDGVYSVMVWAKLGSEDQVVSHYSIFHGVTPPDTYNAEHRDRP